MIGRRSAGQVCTVLNFVLGKKIEDVIMTTLQVMNMEIVRRQHGLRSLLVFDAFSDRSSIVESCKRDIHHAGKRARHAYNHGENRTDLTPIQSTVQF
jgi:hypothetical protein